MSLPGGSIYIPQIASMVLRQNYVRTDPGDEKRKTTNWSIYGTRRR